MIKDFIVLISIVSVMDFWSYIPFLKGELGLLGWFINTFLLLFYLFEIIRKKKGPCRYTTIDKIALFTIITILLGIFPAYYSYGQPMTDTGLACLRLSNGLFLYFVLRRWNYSPTKLMKIVTFVSVIWVVLEIGQQFTYPHFWFSGRFLLYDDIAVRMGLYRFYIWGVDFVMLSLAFWCLKFFSYNNSTSAKNVAFVLFIVLALGILCYCSRKHIYALMLLMAIPIIKLKGRQRRLAIIFSFLALAVLFYNFYDEFSTMNSEATERQSDENGDFVRWVSAKYFLFDFSNDWTYYLFGCGLEVHGSRLARILEDLSTFRIWQADVGIIGYFSKFGLLGVSAIIWYIIEFIKQRKSIDSWLIGFFAMKLMLIIFDFWAIWDVGMSAYAIFLYFLHCNINKNLAQPKHIHSI